MPYSSSRLSPLRWIEARLRIPDIGFHTIVGGMMLVLFGFHLISFQEEHWWGDSYQFLLHAENLLSGQPYANTGYVPSPYDFIAPAAYPVGYPLLLAPVLSVFGASPQMFAMVASLFLLGAAWATASLARGWLPDPYAIGLAVLIALQPGLIAMSRQPLSDPSFLFFVMVCLLAADRASYKPELWNRWVALAGLSLGAAMATKTLGLVLIPALLLPGFIRHRRWERPMLVAACLGLGLLLITSLIPLGTPSLSGTTATTRGIRAIIEGNLAEASKVPEHIVAYLRASFPLWHVPRIGPLKNLLFIVALLPVGLGFIHRVRRRVGPAETFAVLYVLALLPLTFSGTRPLFPLYPIYYMYLVVGVWRLGRDSLMREWATNAALIAAVGLSYGGRYLDWAVQPPMDIVPRTDATLYEYMQATMPDSTVIVSAQDPRPTVYHARRSVSKGPDTISEWTAYADQIGASFALVRDQADVADELLREPRHQLVRRDGDLSLYRICPEACAANEDD